MSKRRLSFYVGINIIHNFKTTISSHTKNFVYVGIICELERLAFYKTAY